MKLYTIGFTQKTAKEFFERLWDNGVQRLVDIRLHPDGQLAGFANREDLRYFLERLIGCDYFHLPELAPNDELFKNYHQDHDWNILQAGFELLMDQRGIPDALDRTYFDEKVCCLLCSEAMDLQHPCPHPPHTEDWIVAPEFKRGEGLLLEEARKTLLNRIADPNVAAIFGAEIQHEQGYYVKENEGTRSLGTVLVNQVDAVNYQFYGDKWYYRICFTDAAGDRYRLGVTDLTFLCYVDFLREQQGMNCNEISIQFGKQFQGITVYLRIGLARPTWEKHPHCCFLQINGVYTFPDYLEGRCFADF